MFESSTGKWLVAAGVLLAFASPAFAATDTATPHVAPPTDTATLLVAQLDSVAAFCSHRFPAKKDQYKAFVNNILSSAAPHEIARIRDTQDYERAREWDLSELDTSKNNAAGTCSGLTALAAH